VKEKLRGGDSEKRSHWLDYAGSRYDEHLIRDSKGLFRVLVYYLPVPMFFALYEQLVRKELIIARPFLVNFNRGNPKGFKMDATGDSDGWVHRRRIHNKTGSNAGNP